VNGIVYCVAFYDDLLFAGGQFSLAGRQHASSLMVKKFDLTTTPNK
jgi:hypothetical protein